MTPEFDSTADKGSQFEINVPYKFVVHNGRGAFEKYDKTARAPVKHFSIAQTYSIGTLDFTGYTFNADGAGWFVYDGKKIIYNLFSTGNTNNILNSDSTSKQLSELTGLKVEYITRSLSS